MIARPHRPALALWACALLTPPSLARADRPVAPASPAEAPGVALLPGQASTAGEAPAVDPAQLGIAPLPSLAPPPTLGRTAPTQPYFDPAFAVLAEPEPRRIHRRALIALGIGGALGLAAVGTGTATAVQWTDDHEHCAPRCSLDERHKVAALGFSTNLLIGGALLAGASALVLYFLERR